MVKHSLQLLCLDYLKQKPKPFFVLDTHAGVGMYDLQGEQANKTGEWHDGIGRLLQRDDAPQQLHMYLEMVRELNDNDSLRWYPGSPWLTAQQLREDDQLTLCELHPIDGQELLGNFRRTPNVMVKTPANGYQAIKSLLPPPQKRGLVLIDPPFEQTDEFAQVQSALVAGMKRWATGCYVVWYPIKDPQRIRQFQSQLNTTLGHDKLYAIDFLVREAVDTQRLNGCGMLFINPPYGLVQQAPELMTYLTKVLAQDEGARYHADWITQ